MSDKELGWALKNGDIDKVKEIIESNVSLGQIVYLTYLLIFFYSKLKFVTETVSEHDD